MTENKNTIVVVGLVISVIVLAAAIGIGAFVLNSPTECGTGDSNTLDLWRARNFAGSAFESDIWSNSYAVLPYRVNVAWDAPDLGALASLEYLIFNCGYTAADLDEYYSDANFSQIIFSSYENPQKTKFCQSGDLRLYEFSAKFDGQEYTLAQWVKPDGDKRVAGFFMTFPTDNVAGLRTYAEKIFPELPYCP